jgi:hypothetical protein
MTIDGMASRGGPPGSEPPGPEPPGPDAPLPGWRPGEDLWPREEDMRRLVEAGELLDLDAGSEPTAMAAWGPDREIRAAVLRYLLVDSTWLVHSKGVRLRGARILGGLDLEAATLRCPLRLDNCYLDGPPLVLDYAAVSLLTVTRCQLAGLTGEALTVSKDLDLAGSTFTGPVALVGADITGSLKCSDARLDSADGDGNALDAMRLKVGGTVFLDRVTAAGAVRLAGADITGNLECSGARLNRENRGGDALTADVLKVGGDVFLSEVTAAGTIWVVGADITGNLECSGARLNRANTDGCALIGDVLKVGGDLFLDHIIANGAVWLAGADVARDLYFSGARLNRAGSDGAALVADLIQVGGHAYLQEGFTAAGTVSLQSARVGGSLWLSLDKPAEDTTGQPAGDTTGKAAEGTTGTALDATGAQIARKLWWWPTEQVTGLVILEDAAVGQLEDSWTGDGHERSNGYWPRADEAQLRLDGFTYHRFGGEQVKLEQRLTWIGSQPKLPGRQERLKRIRQTAFAVRAPRQAWRARKDRRARRGVTGFTPQPYEQLAKAYQQAGQDREARAVVLARRRDLRRYGKLTWYRYALNWLLDKTIQYGYQTWRAAVGIAVLYAAVLVVFSYAQHRAGLIVPVQSVQGLHPRPTASLCTGHYPCFSPAGYALDTVIPLINVHQADYWGPNASAGSGWLLVYVSWSATLLGYAFATLAVAGFTGLVRNTDAL